VGYSLYEKITALRVAEEFPPLLFAPCLWGSRLAHPNLPRWIPAPRLRGDRHAAAAFEAGDKQIPAPRLRGDRHAGMTYD